MICRPSTPDRGFRWLKEALTRQGVTRDLHEDFQRSQRAKARWAGACLVQVKVPAVGHVLGVFECPMGRPVRLTRGLLFSLGNVEGPITAQSVSMDGFVMRPRAPTHQRSAFTAPNDGRPQALSSLPCHEGSHAQSLHRGRAMKGSHVNTTTSTTIAGATGQPHPETLATRKHHSQIHLDGPHPTATPRDVEMDTSIPSRGRQANGLTPLRRQDDAVPLNACLHAHHASSGN